MSTRDKKREIQNLKGQLKETYQKNDFRLLKLTLFMVILAVIAAIVHGRLQLW